MNELLNSILSVLGDNVISVIVFGSYTRRKDYNDIDVFILTKRQLSEDEIIELREKEPRIHVFNYTPQTLKHIPILFLYNVSMGMILYDENDYMKTIFDRLTKKLKEVNAFVSESTLIIPKPHSVKDIINYVFRGSVM